MARLVSLVVVAATLIASPTEAAPPRRIGAPLDVAAITDRAEGRVAARALRPAPAPRTYWTFTRRPSEPGDFRISLGAARFEVLGSTSTGLHLRRRATGEDFWYAGALLTDASGRTTRVQAVQENGDLVLVVPAQVLASFAYPLELDPDVGPAIEVAPAEGQAVAYDGTNFLLAWSSGGEIRAARLSPEGALLDPAGISIAQGSAGDEQLSVAFDGEVYLVSWVERTTKTYDNGSGLLITGPTSHFYVARVDPAGQVLDQGATLVTDDEYCIDIVCEYDKVSVAVAQDGSSFLVFGTNYNYTLVAQVGPNGDVLGLTRTPWPAYMSFSYLRNPSIAFDGSSYLTVALDAQLGAIVAKRLTPDGSPLDPGWTTLFGVGGMVFFQDPTLYPRTAIASAGDPSLVVWTGADPGTAGFYAFPTAVYVSRVSGTGAVLDPGGIPLAQQLPVGPTIATAFDGCAYVTAWNDQAVRIGTDGALLDPTPWLLAGPVTAMASDGAGTVLVASGTRVQFVRTCGPTAGDPVFDPPPSPVAEATGPLGAAVAFEVTAQNENGPALVTCAPAPGSVFPLGTTAVLCEAADPTDPSLTSSATFDVVVRDTTPPTLGSPRNVVADAVAPTGAAVAFPFTPTDLADPSPRLTCTRPPGSTFPIGVTAVTCSAQDASGNVSPAVTFTVSVRGAAEQIVGLMALVNSLGLKPAVARSLVVVLQSAAANAGNCTRACTLMSGFVAGTALGQVVGAIPSSQAAQLRAAAHRIRGVLSCPAVGRSCGG